MKRWLLAAAAVLALAAGAAAQTGGTYTGVATTTVNRQVVVLPGAQITVCAYNASGVPCTPEVTVYTDPTLGTVLPQPITADSYGNFSFSIAPGAYQYCVAASGTTTQCYQVSVPWTGGSASITNLTAVHPAIVPGASRSTILFPSGQNSTLVNEGGDTFAQDSTTPLAGTNNFFAGFMASVYAQTGGDYISGYQPDYPDVYAEGLLTTQGQIGPFSMNVGYGIGNVQGWTNASIGYGGTSQPLNGSSMPFVAASGESDAEEGTVVSTITTTSAISPSSTSFTYTPVSGSTQLGAREFFNLTENTGSGNGSSTGCGISYIDSSGHVFFSGSGCAFSSSNVGQYLIPNTTQFGYAATSGACTAGTSDYTTDTTTCIGVPYYIKAVVSATEITLQYPVDQFGLLDMYPHATATNGAVRTSNVVTATLTDTPYAGWAVGSYVSASCTDTGFNGTFELTGLNVGGVDGVITYAQTASNASTTCTYELRHNASGYTIPYATVDGIVAKDVNTSTNTVTLETGANKTWASGDTLISPPSPWKEMTGADWIVYHNDPLQGGSITDNGLNFGLRIRPGGPDPIDYGIDFYPPVTNPGGVRELINVEPSFGTLDRGLDLSRNNVSDCVLCIAESTDNVNNMIKWGAAPNLMGTAQLYENNSGVLEVRGPAAGAFEIADTGNHQGWTFSVPQSQYMTLADGQAHDVLQDQAGAIVLGNSLGVTTPGGVVVGSPTGGNEGAGTINAQGVYVNGSPVQYALANITTHVTVANTTTPTVLWSTSIPGGILGTSASVSADSQGLWSLASSPGTVTLTLSYGGQTVANTPVTPGTGTVTNLPWDFRCRISADGATNTQFATCTARAMGTGPTYDLGIVIGGALTVDSTTAQTLSLSWTWGTASASNSLTFYHATVTAKQ